MNPVSIPDLEARFRPLSDAEKTVAQAWLDDAWEEVQARIPNVTQRLNEGTLSEGLLRKVISAMVVRVLRNPDAVKSWAVDDYSQTRDAAIAAGALYLSDDETALLRGQPTELGSFSGSFAYRTC